MGFGLWGMCSNDDNYDDGDDYADGIAINDINYVNYKIMRGQFSNSYSQLLIMLILTSQFGCSLRTVEKHKPTIRNTQPMNPLPITKAIMAMPKTGVVIWLPRQPHPGCAQYVAQSMVTPAANERKKMESI